MSNAAQAVPHNHAVNFYDHDRDVVADVARFAAQGLARGERVVIVATAEHRDALDEVLIQHGTDVVRARIAGRYLTFDADETLAKIMVKGVPDAARFAATVGAVIDAAAADGCAVRVFGEMVALLWDEDNVAAAIALESLWNGLGARSQFSLLCAYPASALAGGSLNDTNRVCELHSEVLPPRSYSSAAVAGPRESAAAVQVSDVFVPVPAAVSAARRFTTDVLRTWGEDDLGMDAALVTSELATNAVEHAGTPFRVRLDRCGDVVRITIEDVGPARPRLRLAAADDFGGRGVSIVQTLSQRWGCDALPEGKTVWAELATGQHPL